MAEENLLGTEVRNRLIAGHYLHSNRYNFQNMLLGIRGGFDKEQHLKDTDLYKNIGNLINMARAEEADFYSGFGVTSAQQFSRKFLSLEYKEEDKGIKSEEQKVMEVINNIDFSKIFENKISKSKLTERINTQMQLNLNLGSSDEVYTKKEIVKILQRELIEDLDRKVQKAIREATDKNPALSASALQKIEKSVSTSFFNANGTFVGELPKRVLSTSAMLAKTENIETSTIFKAFKKIVERNLKETYAELEPLAKQGIEEFGKRIRLIEPKISDENVSKYMTKWKKIINDELKDSKNKAEVFILSNFRGKRTGALGEMSLSLVYEWLTPIGQGLAPREIYKNDKKNKKTKVTEVDMKNRSDASYMDKNGKIWYFQIKNSFSEVFKPIESRANGFYPIKVNGPINLENFLTQLSGAGYISEQTHNELLYSIINFEFLSKHGISENGAPNINKSESPELTKYITQLLGTGLMYFLGLDKNYRDIKGDLDDSKKQFNGNLFFILANKYLVPFSFFLEAIQAGLEDQEQSLLKVMRPAITLTGSVDAEKLYERKHEQAIAEGLLEKDKNQKENGEKTPFKRKYDYPQSIYSLGVGAGENLVSGASIKTGIHILMNMDKMKAKFEEKIKGGI